MKYTRPDPGRTAGTAPAEIKVRPITAEKTVHASGT
jgi:hypothetical protein